jgi:putative transposase
MPNHYHLIIKCGKDAMLITKFMRSFMVAYAMYFNRKHDKVGHLFQGPFQVRRLQGIRDLETVKNYLKNNPLEAELIGGEEKESYRWLYIRNEQGMNEDWFKI